MNATNIEHSDGGPTRPARKGTAVALGVLIGLFWLSVIGWWMLLPLLRGSGEAVPLEESQATPETAMASSAVTASEAMAGALTDVPDGTLPPSSAEQPAPEIPDRPVMQVTHGSDWIVASWSGTGAVDRWEVDGPEGRQALTAKGATSSRMRWEALKPGSRVEIRVRAVNAAGRSGWAVAEVSLPKTAAVPEEAAPSPLDDEDGDSPWRPPPYAVALEDMFVAVLVSAESEAAAEGARTRLEREHGRPFGILLSDDFASLNPGYWVVYAGPYATGAETRTACWWELGRRSGAECYGRRLSQDPSDRDSVYGPSPE
ncbi:MAG: fibronectin type III domain-containing protein [Acidimicrobiales bacterium]|nr:hypothetical protein [Acidimicrobiaceae bacterium]MXV85925.1 fibronectin type III domain-containing protein [Acidimicrobiales bacterium]MXX43661.1 fibronectin type III domain-containing protein [Acidimicrobiales bacterium]MXZ15582.1 fibronectin type III domain-containing protein [Acidimicrobiales bacterium]MYB82224.1 fibronectin type III domain-containing protein [Acidimicrobiales bacterium]